MIDALGKVFSGKSQVVDKAFGLIDDIWESKEERRKAKRELMRLDQEDRKSREEHARKLFQAETADRDSARRARHLQWLQQVYALVFLIVYVLMAGGIIAGLVYMWQNGRGSVPNEIMVLMAAIEGRMSAKVSTITDFLYGGKAETESEAKNQQTLAELAQNKAHESR